MEVDHNPDSRLFDEARLSSLSFILSVNDSGLSGSLHCLWVEHHGSRRRVA